jgi:hypothetical protein
MFRNTYPVPLMVLKVRHDDAHGDGFPGPVR